MTMPLRKTRGGWIISTLVCAGLVLLAVTAKAAPKRVLIVHSFGNAAPPFTTHSTAFETELAEKMKEPVDLDEVSLDVARYASLDMEEALVALMHARQAKWQPDLVVPIGSPAGIFVARHRDRLFPESTPIVYTGMDISRLPAGAIERNAAFVGESFDVRGWVEDILQIAPDTTNIAVVIGDSPLERLWADVLKKEYQPLAGRVSFTWLNDLSLEGILQRTKNLPPHSFILDVLMLRDASGVTHDGDEVLRQIHAVANAPINGIYQHQLGLGITGGRLYQGEAEGVEAARIAIRILHGEPASSFQPMIIGPLPPRYDWRELQKWNIDEKLLPKGSTILYQTPTGWQKYRVWIIGSLAVILVQAVLIGVLITNLVRRRRAERSLRESETRVALATRAARLGVWELNTKTSEMWISDRMRELFDLEPGAVVDLNTIGNRVHPEDRAAREAAIDRAIHGLGEYEIEYRILRPDRTVRWISGRGRRMDDAHGKPTRVFGVSMDITERKEAEELFRLATEASPSGMLLVEQGNRIVLANAHVEEMFGYGREELIGRPVETLVPGPFVSGPAAGRELMAHRKNGSEFPIELGLNPVKTPGSTLVLATVTDLSSRKRAEEEARRQREQIGLLGRASLLGEMTASLAHELKQPLAAIVANASAGVRFIDGGEIEPSALREMFADIGSAGRRACDIIQSVRNAIKKGSSVRGQIGINSVVTNVALMVRPDAAVYLCEVETSLTENLPVIEADPIQMQQVLINLVTNAFHAMSETLVAQRKVEIATGLDDHGFVRVTVRDHGTGISEQTQERLFEHFYTTRMDGLGMGLAIVRSIIEAHGGKITAGNAEGGGARFDFRLPAVAKPRG